ncbi:MAG: hypothetical protein AUJ52_06365 [Elusimicrobia bacterium CG1_02_63_36]|nr:MAG: hypothetical protein AUJ52_06365 [Elusimicrobia bacterium CG1_02_63_36]
MPLFVYEATNADLKERFVGVSHVPPRRLEGLNRSERPEFGLSWDFARHTIRYHMLMETTSKSQADAFAWEFRRATPMPGWKLL